MARTFLFILLAGLMMLTSCVFSLFPIYTKDTLVDIPEFEGIWQGDENDRIEVKKLGKITSMDIKITPDENDYIIKNGDTIRDKEEVAAYFENELKKSIENTIGKKLTGYQMTIIDSKDTIVYRAHIAKIGNNLFLDLFPFSESDLYDKAVMNNYIPVHSFMKIETKEGEMSLTEFDLDKLRDLFRANKIRLRHEDVDDMIVITAQPEEIQKFLMIYSENEEVFDNTSSYKKVVP